MILYSQETIDEFTQLGFWRDKVLTDYLKQNVANNPDKEALVDPPNKEELTGQKPVRLTWSEIDKLVDRVALGFVELGLKPDDFAVMQLPNVMELIITHFALTRIGVIVVPGPVQYRNHELGYAVELSEAKAVVVPGHFHGFDHVKMANEIRAKYPHLKHVISLGKDLPEGVLSLYDMLENKLEDKYAPDYLDQFKPTANDVMTLVLTSGTEALPKGVPRSHNNWFGLLPVMTMMSSVFNMSPSDEITQGAFPLVNMAGLGTMVYPWVGMGSKIILHHPFDAELFLTQIEKERVTFAGGPPAVHYMLLNHPTIEQHDLSSIKFMGGGSAPLTTPIIKGWRERFGIEVINVYGSNEGMGLFGMDPDAEKRASYFSTEMAGIVGFQVKVVDEEGNDLTKPGDKGELVGKGPFLFPCYYKRPDLTEKAFTKDGFFRSGDLFIIEDEGKLRSGGRVKDLIIRGGQNISPEDIEDILNAHPKVLESAAVGMPDAKLGERVCVFVIPKEGQKSLTLDEISSFMKEHNMAVFKLPERLEIVNDLPRTPVGKIWKRVLREEVTKKIEAEQAST